MEIQQKPVRAPLFNHSNLAVMLHSEKQAVIWETPIHVTPLSDNYKLNIEEFFSPTQH